MFTLPLTDNAGLVLMLSKLVSIQETCHLEQLVPTCEEHDTGEVQDPKELHLQNNNILLPGNRKRDFKTDQYHLLSPVCLPPAEEVGVAWAIALLKEIDCLYVLTCSWRFQRTNSLSTSEV